MTLQTSPGFKITADYQEERCIFNHIDWKCSEKLWKCSEKSFKVIDRQFLNPDKVYSFEYHGTHMTQELSSPSRYAKKRR